MPELAVIVPTLNEKDNVTPMVEALGAALAGIDYEIVFVDDDSIDGTAAYARAVAQRNPRVRVLQRVQRRGLSSAVVEGMMASSAPYLAVIDADGQHDERILPQMLAKLKDEDLDLVIGSRHVEGGGMGEFAKERVALSNLGKRLALFVAKADVSDPMSGFFILRRAYLDEVVHSLSSIGFKILLDLVASSRRQVRFGEVAYTFRKRLRGQSKLDILVGLEYMELLVDKVVGNWIPVRYVIFGGVGALGVVLNLVLLYLLNVVTGFDHQTAQIAAAAIVIAPNFLLNNQLTFRAYRLKGIRLIWGMALFYLACGVGLWTNVKVAQSLREAAVSWYSAGLVGIVIGSVWNYWVSSVMVWRVNRRR